jgi:hypothetical protein
MIVVGGSNVRFGQPPDGAAYNPATDTWRALAPVNLPVFPKSVGVKSVWTGSRMLLWDGEVGVAYDPQADQWTAISSDTGVARRTQFNLIWTGQEMIEWGRFRRPGDGPRGGPTYYRDGSRYDPATDTWAPISALGAPPPSDSDTAVWTGEQMLIWPTGGGDPGYAYRPYWLTVRQTTQAFGIDDAPLFAAQPGERYRVVELQDSWALVQLLGDPPALQEWIAIDDHVELSAPTPA